MANTQQGADAKHQDGIGARLAEAGLKRLLGPILRWVLRQVFRLHNKIEVSGLDHLEAAGTKAVLIANHVSFLDAAILAAHLPGNPVFAVNLGASQWWWMRLVMPMFNCVTLDTRNPMAIKTLVRIIESGRRVVIFPEGRLTVTNGLMKVYSGPGMVADKAKAQIVPIRLEGVHFSPLSRLGHLNPVGFGHRFAMTVLPPRPVPATPGLAGGARREAIGDWLYDEMRAMMADSTLAPKTLYAAFLAAGEDYGWNRPICESIDPVLNLPVAASYRRLALGAEALGRALAQTTAKGERVGVLLPNAVGSAAVFLALQSIGRVPALLNFTAGTRNLLAACDAAQIHTVITAQAFLDAAKLEPLAEAIAASGRRIVRTETIKRQIGPLAKARAFLALGSAAVRESTRGAQPHDPAVVLFTSGSEGLPKGVVLTHANLLANIAQIAACIDFSPADTVLNALPMFHSFGLTAGTLLPLLRGIKTFLFANPLNYKAVPELAYDRNATILFGTDTFLAGYARKAHPLDFRSVRYIFAGAEKVKDATRRVYAEKFQRSIYEGYGSTECSPVIALNCPMGFKIGTVGRLMPRIEHQLIPVEGVEGGGRLRVRGPNVMAGYLRAENPGVLESPEDGWYDTGDIVAVDAQGFVTILGRAKRFAKIAGEMVSLAAVEQQAARLRPEAGCACAAVKDERKGERLVLYTTDATLTAAELSADAKQAGISELAVPKTVVRIDALPLLGSGKIDHGALTRAAAELVAGGADAAVLAEGDEEEPA